MALERKLNMGMVGGGKDAFIGGFIAAPRCWTARSTWLPAPFLRIRTGPRNQRGNCCLTKNGLMERSRKWPKPKQAAPRGTH